MNCEVVGGLEFSNRLKTLGILERIRFPGTAETVTLLKLG